MKTCHLVGVSRVSESVLPLFLSHYTLVGVVNRTPSKAHRLASEYHAKPFSSVEALPPANLWIIGVQDDAIESVAAALAATQQVRESDIVLHFSGALPASVLTETTGLRARVVSAHPPFPFPKVIPRDDWAHVTWVLEGEGDAVQALIDVFEGVGQPVVTLPSAHKALYHALCTVLSGGPFAMATWANSLSQRFGWSNGFHYLQPLWQAAVQNLAHQGVGALTGPHARGETRTLAAHQQALTRASDEQKALYDTVATWLKTLLAHDQSDSETSLDPE